MNTNRHQLIKTSCRLPNTHPLPNSLPHYKLQSEPSNTNCLDNLQKWMRLKISWNQTWNSKNGKKEEIKPFLSRTFNLCMVLRDMTTVDTRTKVIAMQDTMFAAFEDSGCSIKSQIHFWYLNSGHDSRSIYFYFFELYFIRF